MSSDPIPRRPETLIQFVCLAKHRGDPASDEQYSLESHRGAVGYCARGATRNHEWIRVPVTRLDNITVALKEDRPPAPATPRERSRYRR